MRNLKLDAGCITIETPRGTIVIEACRSRYQTHPYEGSVLMYFTDAQGNSTDTHTLEQVISKVNEVKL